MRTFYRTITYNNKIFLTKDELYNMKYDFYTLTYNDIIIATSLSRNSLTNLHIKLKQNPKQLEDLIRYRRVIVLPENDDEAQKLIDSIREQICI